MTKLVLFDIDGTLVWSKGAGRNAIHTALLDEMGTAGPIDGYQFAGKTDPQIVMELLALAGHPEARNADRVQRVCARYVELLEEHLAVGGGLVWALEGVLDLLDALEARSDVVIGLLTGNVRRGAELKLGKAGLAFDRFRVGAFGSDAAVRAELPPFAVERAEPIMGRRPSGHDVVIIGDTPDDVRCGEGVGARALAVATGHFSEAELAQTGAFRVFPDLCDTTAVIDAIVT